MEKKCRRIHIIDNLPYVEFSGDRETAICLAKNFLGDAFVKDISEVSDNPAESPVCVMRTFHGQEVVTKGEIIVKEAGYFDHYSKEDFYIRFEDVSR